MEESSPTSNEGGQGDYSVNGTFTKKSRERKKTVHIKQSASKLNFGEATDDVHVCIMCMRAIMNHQVREEDLKWL